MNSTTDFKQQISAIDKQLALKYPLMKRIWKTLKEIYPDTARVCMDTSIEIRPQDMSNVHKVYKWYKEKYPNQEHIIDSLGYKPFLLNGKIYHILTSLDRESDLQKMNHKLKERIYDMTQLEKDSLTENDMKQVLSEYIKGGDLYYKLHTLEMNIEDGKINHEINDLLVPGIFDINISLSAFISPFYFDSQPVMFHAQQASEKFLKSLYAHYKLAEIHASTSVDCYMRTQYGHNINRLRQDLNAFIADFDKIDIKVQKIHNEVPDMDIRYKDSGKTIEDAICCIDLMIEICSYVAEKISKLGEI